MTAPRATPEFTPSERAELLARIDARLDKAGPIVREDLGPCWDWRGAKNTSGYGMIGVGSKPWLVHRLVVILAGGLSGDAPIAMHRCDRPQCCNPKHLQAGALHENQADKWTRGLGVAANQRTRVGDFDTDGSRALREWRGARYGGQTSIATHCGVSLPTALRWIFADCRPTDEHLLSIFALTGIPPLSFKTPEERERLARFVAIGLPSAFPSAAA